MMTAKFTVPSTRPVPTDLLADALPGHTPRDRWAVRMLAEHGVLTTGQLTALGFHDTAGGALRRLRILARRGWLHRLGVVPVPGTTTFEACWCLGPLGAAITSGPARRLPSPADVYRAQQRLRPGLLDRLATNQVFVDLAAYARTTPGVDLRSWWSPRTCAAVVAPARHTCWYGEIIDHGRRIGFWLEPDPGDLDVAALARRVRRYPQLALRTGVGTVLFAAAGAEREAGLQERLARVDRTGLTVATAVAGGADLGGNAWLPAGGGVRLALADLPTAPPLRHPGEDAPFLDAPGLAPHPIHDPARPYDEAVADGEYSYA